MQSELADYVNEKVKIPLTAFLYRGSTNGGPDFPKAMASHINTFFNPVRPVQASDIITTSALTAMHHLTAFSIGDPGDAILVGRPIYGRFELDFGNVADLKIEYTDMEGVDPFGEDGDVIGRYEAALENAVMNGIKVTAVLIVNPNNPTGMLAFSSCITLFEEQIPYWMGSRKMLHQGRTYWTDAVCRKP